MFQTQRTTGPTGAECASLYRSRPTSQREASQLQPAGWRDVDLGAGRGQVVLLLARNGHEGNHVLARFLEKPQMVPDLFQLGPASPHRAQLQVEALDARVVGCLDQGLTDLGQGVCIPKAACLLVSNAPSNLSAHVCQPCQSV